MPVDVEFDENLDVVINDRNDLGLVDGVDQETQSVRVYLADYLSDSVGILESDNVVERLTLLGRRALSDNPHVDNIQGVLVEESDEKHGAYEITLYYNGTQLSEEVGNDL